MGLGGDAAYRGAVAWLDEARRLKDTPGLERVGALLRELGDPHLAYPVVHVAGTNGKGSTCAFIAAILRAAGRRVGEFTSPEMGLEDHVRVDGRRIGRAAVADGVAALRRACAAMGTPGASTEPVASAGHPSHFELLTALAFWYFARRSVDAAVVEVGMGGTLDATNVVVPEVACITYVALDHVAELGGTLQEVLAHKAGVIKRSRPLVTAERDPRLLAMLEDRCRAAGAPLVAVGRDVTWRREGGGDALTGERFDLRTPRREYRGLATRLFGPHQVANAATAVAVVEVLAEALAGRGWGIGEGAVRDGLRRARRPCRLERLAARPMLVLDGAHNPDGAARLREALAPVRARFSRLTLVAGAMADKDIAGIMRELLPLGVDEVIACRARSARAAAAAAVVAAARDAGAGRVVAGGGVAAALARAMASSGPRDMVLVAGSLYVAGEARAAWLGRRAAARRSYRDACCFLGGLPRFPPGRGVERAEELLAACGHPDRGLGVVHVAGTAGKGSTAAMIDAIARAAGIASGLFTSPHLVSYTERVRVGSRPASGAEFARLVGAVRPAAEAMMARGAPPAMFDVATAAALLGFARRGCRLAVLEVGLGGRRDATNAVTPLVCVITSIALEHTQVLGDSVAAIAAEKAGIIKPGVPVISGVDDAVARDVIVTQCAASGARLIESPRAVEVVGRRFDEHGQTFTLRTPRGLYRDLRLPLLGEYQVRNAAMAVLAVEELAGLGFTIDERAVAEGLAAVRWPGRLEVVRRQPLLILDGAHSPDRCRALAAALAEHFPGRRPLLVMGVMDDKAVDDMVAALAPGAAMLIATRPPNHPLDPRRVAAAARTFCPARVVERPGAAVRWALERAGAQAGTQAGAQAGAHAGAQAGARDMVVVTGSLYLVGAVKRWLGRGGAA